MVCPHGMPSLKSGCPHAVFAGYVHAWTETMTGTRVDIHVLYSLPDGRSFSFHNRHRDAECSSSSKHPGGSPFNAPYIQRTVELLSTPTPGHCAPCAVDIITPVTNAIRRCDARITQHFTHIFVKIMIRCHARNVYRPYCVLYPYAIFTGFPRFSLYPACADILGIT